MEIKRVDIKDLIVPRRLIFRNELYKILNYPDKYVIKGYTVTLVDNKIDEVTIRDSHPNANPTNGEVCIPHLLREFQLNKDTKKMISEILSCFNLDNCYFTPWDEIQYRRQEV